MNKITAFRLGIKIFGSMLLAGVTGVFLGLVFVGFGEAVWIRVIIQSIMLLLYYMLIYNTVWRDGFLEKNRVQCAFSVFDPLKGLKAGLYAVVPSYALWALMVALSPFHVNLDGIYRFLHFFAIDIINAFMQPNLPLQEHSFGQLLASTCFLAAIPVLCGVGYLLGYKRFSFTEVFIFKKKAKALTKEEAAKIRKQ